MHLLKMYKNERQTDMIPVLKNRFTVLLNIDESESMVNHINQQDTMGIAKCHHHTVCHRVIFFTHSLIEYHMINTLLI